VSIASLQPWPLISGHCIFTRWGLVSYSYFILKVADQLVWNPPVNCLSYPPHIDTMDTPAGHVVRPLGSLGTCGKFKTRTTHRRVQAPSGNTTHASTQLLFPHHRCSTVPYLDVQCVVRVIKVPDPLERAVNISPSYCNAPGPSISYTRFTPRRSCTS